MNSPLALSLQQFGYETARPARPARPAEANDPGYWGPDVFPSPPRHTHHRRQQSVRLPIVDAARAYQPREERPGALVSDSDEAIALRIVANAAPDALILQHPLVRTVLERIGWDRSEAPAAAAEREEVERGGEEEVREEEEERRRRRRGVSFIVNLDRL